MGERGYVTRATDETVVVILKRSEACAKCKACTAELTQNEMIINARNLCKAKEGDYVNIELESANFLKAVFIMYGVPCLFFITGIFLGYYILHLMSVQGDTELIAFLIGSALMIAAFFLIKINEKRLSKQKHIPIATRIVD